ncbi:MAG: hypothetical protein JXR77_04975 [Lentisphaeria bacterium]|nr:hypothetical protein [Lentisphaeria bacterium]
MTSSRVAIDVRGARSGACLLLALLLSAVVPSAWGSCLRRGDRSGVCGGWLKEGDVSPFFPDDAFTIQAPGHRHAYVRGVFESPSQPRRAVLALTGWHTLAVFLNGTLVCEYRSVPPERVPAFFEVTDWVRQGPNRLDVRVWSEWNPTLYMQVRVELADGEFADAVTDRSWEYCPAPAEGWPRGAAPSDGWQPVEETDDYYGSRGQAQTWHREFALMPRELLAARLGRHNEALRAGWALDRDGPRPVFVGTYTDPVYAAQYAAHLKLDSAGGQVVDAGGQVRHLFFNVYNQKVAGSWVLHWSEFDFDRLEHDLTLMEQAEVHPYLRFLGWHRLLDGNGDWNACEQQPRGTNLPQFARAVEVLDHFLDRCQSHGRFVMIECDFHWAASWDAVPAPYHTRYYLHPEAAEANALAHRRILSRYRDRPVVAGFMMGEEDIIMAHDLDNSDMRRAFRDSLRRRHGTLQALAAAWEQGCDRDSPEAWTPGRRRPNSWGGDAEGLSPEAVLLPTPRTETGFWDTLGDWESIPLPAWPHCRRPEAPHPELPSQRLFPGELEAGRDDPLWIDYHALREDELYLDFVSRWYHTVREGVPRQWLFHSNAQDYTAHWHFLHCFRRAALPHPVIGVGSHDSGLNLAEIPPWDRLRKYIRVIASYRPYVVAPGSAAVAVASGEGEGGRRGDREATRDYYLGQSFEMVGNGAAFEMSYIWSHLAGGEEHPEGKATLTEALEAMGRFYRDSRGVTFSLDRRVPILVVRNNNLQRSNRSGRDFGNALGLAAAVAQLNIPFDIAMDQDLSYGPRERRVDLARYDVVFLPCIECDYPENAWQTLDAWLSDDAFRGRRTLVLGYVGCRSPYLAPRDGFHPVLRRWLGTDGYADSVSLRGASVLHWMPIHGAQPEQKVRIHFGDRADISPTGILRTGKPLLTTPDGRAVAVSTLYRGNRVCAFGFPLGLAFDHLWGLPAGRGNGTPAPQEPYDVMARIFDDILEGAEIERPIRAPHHVRVACSDDRSLILVREICGIETTELCTLVLPEGAVYSGCTLEPQGDGRTMIRSRLPAYGARWFKRSR